MNEAEVADWLYAKVTATLAAAPTMGDLEQAIERGNLPADLAARVKKALADNLQETMFFQGNSMIRAFEEYYFGWQERSARLYGAAADAAKTLRN